MVLSGGGGLEPVMRASGKVRNSGLVAGLHCGRKQHPEAILLADGVPPLVGGPVVRIGEALPDMEEEVVPPQASSTAATSVANSSSRLTLVVPPRAAGPNCGNDFTHDSVTKPAVVVAAHADRSSPCVSQHARTARHLPHRKPTSPCQHGAPHREPTDETAFPGTYLRGC